jgi:hypothetical protein
MTISIACKGKTLSGAVYVAKKEWRDTQGRVCQQIANISDAQLRLLYGDHDIATTIETARQVPDVFIPIRAHRRRSSSSLSF